MKMKVHRSVDALPEFKSAVVTFGTFDGVHLGHKKILNRIISLAREFDGESVLVTFHPHPRSIIYPKDKSLHLLSTLEEKIGLFEKTGLDHLVIVPFSFEFSRLSPQEYVERFIMAKFNPVCVVIGYDHKFGLNRQGDFDLLTRYANEGKFKLEKIVKQDLDEVTISSTKIRDSLAHGEMEQSRMLLGYDYFIQGKVIHGDKIGRKIGFPTANIVINDKDKLIPKIGIYAAKVEVDGIMAECMAYIGNRPTIDTGLKKNIEVHIFDFNSNIYTKEIKLHFVSFIREDQKFGSLDALANQLKLDEIRTKEILKHHRLIQKKKSCAIAILNYNNSEYLQSFIPVIYDTVNDETQVYVIDNNSTDDSLEMLEEWFPEVKVITLSKNYGFADGYNKGLKNIEEEYVVLLNSDVKVKDGWLSKMMDMIKKDKSIGAVMPKILSLENPESFEYAGAAGGIIDSLGYPFCRGRMFDTLESDDGQYQKDLEIAWASGAALLIRKEVFEKIGGFDESFFAHQEEIDLCWRLRRAGYKIMCTPAAEVEHLGGGTLDYESPNKVYLNFRNNLKMITKNETFSRLLLILPARLVLDGIAGLRFLFSGNVKGFTSVIRAHFAYYFSMGSTIDRARKDKKKIENMRIGYPRNSGKLSGSILIQYYLLRRKKYSDLKK